MTGTLIVIEGTDGSGKETQSKRLVKRLESEGKKVAYIEFPQYGKPSAALVEQYLNGDFGSSDDVSPYQAAMLYALDRFAKKNELKKLLEDGTTIICNRYVSANKGHQAGKIKDQDERNKFIEWVDDLEYTTLGLPRPNKVLLLHMPPEVGQKLVEKKGHRDYVGGEKKDIHEADINHLKNAEQAFLDVAKKEDWEIIECAKDNEPLPIEDIHDMVYSAINESNN